MAQLPHGRLGQVAAVVVLHGHGLALVHRVLHAAHVQGPNSQAAARRTLAPADHMPPGEKAWGH